ncbi:MAG: hypothetical protein U1A78_26410 [Polyangia bacterium]
MRNTLFMLLSGLWLSACSTPASRCPAGAVCDAAGTVCQSRVPSIRPGCSPDGWCALGSPVAGPALYAIWGRSASSAWAVGDKGTILRWDGASWAAQPSPVTVNLNGIWGSDAGTLWAVGDAGTVLRGDGTSFAMQASPTAVNLFAVWGSDPNNVWAVGRSGFILHWNGAAWTTEASGTSSDLLAVWGSGADSVWAVGETDSLLGDAASRPAAAGSWSDRTA